MSSLSPRGSISGNASAAVSEDFADSLRDLTQNNRYEISNLTIIAKENTEHAQAISKALESHIKTVRLQFDIARKKQKQFRLLLFAGCCLNKGLRLTLTIGNTSAKITCALRPGLDSEERWNTIYCLSRPWFVQHVHGSLYSRGWKRAQSHGRHAQDLEGTSPWVHGQATRVPT